MCIRDRVRTPEMSQPQPSIYSTTGFASASRAGKGKRSVCWLPWHRDLDGLEEARLKDKKYGSTKQGIAPFYSDKFQKKTVMAGELLYPGQLRSHLEDLLEWKNLTLTKVYNAQPYTIEQLMDWVADYGEKIRPFIRDLSLIHI